MSLVRIDFASALPTAVSDYESQNDHLQAIELEMSKVQLVDFTNNKVPQGAIFQIGGTLYKGTTDTSITGTPSDYVKITPAGATASAAYVASLSGVSWNSTYNGYYDGSGNLYLFDEGLALINAVISVAKTRFGSLRGLVLEGLKTTGAVTIGGLLTASGGITTGGVIKSDTHNTDDIGLTGTRFKDGFFAGTLYSAILSLSGAATVGGLLTASGGITTGGVIKSDTHNTDDIGLTGTRFKDGFFAGTLYSAILSLSGAATVGGLLTANSGAVINGISAYPLDITNSISGTSTIRHRAKAGEATRILFGAGITDYWDMGSTGIGNLTFTDVVNSKTPITIQLNTSSGTLVLSSTGVSVGGLLTASGGITTGGVIKSDAHNTDDIGLTGTRFKDGFFAGTLYAGAVSINSGTEDTALTLESTDMYCSLVIKDATTTNVDALIRTGDNLALVPSGGNVSIGALAFVGSERLRVNGSVYFDNKLTINLGGAFITGGVNLTPGTAPTAAAGTIYYNSSTNHFLGYNGSTWVQLDN